MNTKMKYFIHSLLACLLLPLSARSQSEVSILVGDSVCSIEPVTTQSEYKPGWKIVDIQTRGKSSRYLWGKHSRQFADDRQPAFILRTGQGKVNDFAVIRLKQKKEMRQFPSHNLIECGHRPIDLDLMDIVPQQEGVYRVRFRTPQQPGEYVILNMKSAPLNDMGDVKVYPFTILQ